MAHQHVKGALSVAKGTVEEAVGKVTGNRTLEAKGMATKVQGKAQGAVGDAEDLAKRVRLH